MPSSRFIPWSLKSKWGRANQLCHATTPCLLQPLVNGKFTSGKTLLKRKNCNKKAWWISAIVKINFNRLIPFVISWDFSGGHIICKKKHFYFLPFIIFYLIFFIRSSIAYPKRLALFLFLRYRNISRLLRKLDHFQLSKVFSYLFLSAIFTTTYCDDTVLVLFWGFFTFQNGWWRPSWLYHFFGLSMDNFSRGLPS
jgi:hypothetical protein